jgi:hypothetical protein
MPSSFSIGLIEEHALSLGVLYYMLGQFVFKLAQLLAQLLPVELRKRTIYLIGYPAQPIETGMPSIFLQKRKARKHDIPQRLTFQGFQVGVVTQIRFAEMRLLIYLLKKGEYKPIRTLPCIAIVHVPSYQHPCPIDRLPSTPPVNNSTNIQAGPLL